MGLTKKQRRFVEEYPKDWNATQAAIRAGYSERTAYSIGHENLRKPEIQDAIQERIDQLTMSADEVLIRLAEQARGEHSKYLLENGEVDFEALIHDDKQHLVKSIKETKYGNQIEFYDVQSALVWIGKHHKLFTDNVDLTSGGEPLANTEEIYERVMARVQKRLEKGAARTAEKDTSES